MSALIESMARALAMSEREMLKFFRSPRLMIGSMVIPLLQLVILGAAYGGKIVHARFGYVDHDHGAISRQIREQLLAVEANARTVETIEYTDERRARQDLYEGKLDGALIIPENFTANVLRHRSPHVGLLVDNSDNILSDALSSKLQQIVDNTNASSSNKADQDSIDLSVIEYFPYVEYMKYLLPGSIALAMFVAIMISGGLLYVDDKVKGVHEGFLVTPLSKFDIIVGLNTASIAKAVLSGLSITIIGSLLAGINAVLRPAAVAELFLLICAASIALSGFMFLFVARVEDPLLPRSLFTVFTTVLYFPSGAVYPVQAFPAWLRVVSRLDPFTYIVQGFRAVLLKNSGFAAIAPDVILLLVFGCICLSISVPLFKRTL